MSRTYDKLLLLGALIICIFCLSWLITIFNYAKNEKTEDVSSTMKNYPYTPMQQSAYNFRKFFKDGSLWQVSSKRNANNQDYNNTSAYTDFTKTYPIARSSAPKAMGKLIPYICYKEGYCPITNQKISIPQIKVEEITADIDKDGIPDVLEKQLGLDPNNKNDGSFDIDNDTFSNAQEYQYNPEGVNNPLVHPPLITRIVLEDIVSPVVPLIIKKIIERGDNKAEWDLQVNVNRDGNKWKTQFLKVGSAIELNNIEYKIKDIIKKSQEKLDPRLGNMVEVDLSEIELQGSSGERIIAKLNSTITEPQKIVLLKDLYDGTTYRLRINESLNLGNSTIGYEPYVLKAINEETNSVVFERDGKKYDVGIKTSYIPPSKPTP